MKKRFFCPNVKLHMINLDIKKHDTSPVVCEGGCVPHQQAAVWQLSAKTPAAPSTSAVLARLRLLAVLSHQPQTSMCSHCGIGAGRCRRVDSHWFSLMSADQPGGERKRQFKAAASQRPKSLKPTFLATILLLIVIKKLGSWEIFNREWNYKKCISEFWFSLLVKWSLTVT